MRNKLFTVVLVFASLFSMAWTAHGEITLDSVLVQINSSGRNDFGYFRTEISMAYNIPQSRVNYYHTSLRMSPADIYMAAEISSIRRVPITRVVQVYRVHKGRGWGYISRELGIKPGSKEFRRLMDRGYSMHKKLKYKKSKVSKGYNGYKVYIDNEQENEVIKGDKRYQDKRNR